MGLAVCFYDSHLGLAHAGGGCPSTEKHGKDIKYSHRVRLEGHDTAGGRCQAVGGCKTGVGVLHHPGDRRPH